MSRKKAPSSDKSKKHATNAPKGHTSSPKPEQPRKVRVSSPPSVLLTCRCMLLHIIPSTLPSGGRCVARGPHRLQSACAPPASSPWSFFNWLPQRVRGKTAALWKGDGLAGELAALGLRVKEVASDGNCFFLAMADQLEVFRWVLLLRLACSEASLISSQV